MKNKIFENAPKFSQFNKMSRVIIKGGAALIALVYISALTAYLAAGRYMDYYTAIKLSEDLLVCGKECMGAVFVPALLLEILMISQSGKIEH